MESIIALINYCTKINFFGFQCGIFSVRFRAYKVYQFLIGNFVCSLYTVYMFDDFSPEASNFMPECMIQKVVSEFFIQKEPFSHFLHLKKWFYTRFFSFLK